MVAVHMLSIRGFVNLSSRSNPDLKTTLEREMVWWPYAVHQEIFLPVLLVKPRPEDNIRNRDALVAVHMLSIRGFVSLSSWSNPDLKTKLEREGLVTVCCPPSDFLASPPS